MNTRKRRVTGSKRDMNSGERHLKICEYSLPIHNQLLCNSTDGRTDPSVFHSTKLNRMFTYYWNAMENILFSSKKRRMNPQAPLWVTNPSPGAVLESSVKSIDNQKPRRALTQKHKIMPKSHQWKRQPDRTATVLKHPTREFFLIVEH